MEHETLLKRPLERFGMKLYISEDLEGHFD